MLSFTGSLKIYVAVEPCNMRKSFEGFTALLTTVLEQDVRGEPSLFLATDRAIGSKSSAGILRGFG